MNTFYFLAISTVMNICVTISFYITGLFPWEKCQWEKYKSHMKILFLLFLRNLHSVSTEPESDVFPSIESLCCFFTIFLWILVFPFFYKYIISTVWDNISLLFYLQLPHNKQWWTQFQILLVICLSTLWKCLSTAPFKLWLAFLLLNFLSALSKFFPHSMCLRITLASVLRDQFVMLIVK